MGNAAEKRITTTPGRMSGGGAALVVFWVFITRVVRQRSNKSRKRGLALQASGDGPFRSSAHDFNYCLYGKGSVKKQVKVRHAPDHPLSLSKFMSRPLSEFSLIPLPAGVTM